jgi:enterochelin esterase-like enzyme
MFKKVLGCAAALAAFAAVPAAAQEQARATWATFHSAALEGNLEGNDPMRDVLVVTPPGYDENSGKRYPVVYFLHGYFATPQDYQNWNAFEEAVQGAAEAGNELILVMPNGYSRLKGAMYSNSPVVGNYETMVAHDLVEWVDANYRTIADPASRGLSGHSMGGYGTIRVAMKNPGIFSSIYMMSACCLTPQPINAEQAKAIDKMTYADVPDAQFMQLAGASTGSAWAPDPTAGNALKIQTTTAEDGTIDKLVEYRMAANSPVVILPQHLAALNGLEAFAIDIGDKDFLLQGNRALLAELDRFGVKHSFELYEGDHGNRVKERIRSKLLPFFGEHLDKAP